MVGGDATVVMCVKRENPGPLPSFLAWEGVLATETSDLGMTDDWDKAGETFEGVTRSIVGCD